MRKAMNIRKPILFTRSPSQGEDKSNPQKTETQGATIMNIETTMNTP